MNIFRLCKLWKMIKNETKFKNQGQTSKHYPVTKKLYYLMLNSRKKSLKVLSLTLPNLRP